MKWLFHENQGSFHSDHLFLMVIYNASSRWQIYCLLDDALHRDFGYMNCWAQNILLGFGFAIFLTHDARTSNTDVAKM